MLIDLISGSISYWPLAVFIAFILAGINIPISEDAIIIASAAICNDKKELLVPTLICIYLGIVISNSISYFLGFLCSKGLSGFGKIRRILDSDKKTIIMRRLEKQGFLTFVTIRFVPLGLRNVLFLSSGFFHLKFWRFALYDFTAAILSSQTLFWLVYLLGDNSSLPIKIICGILLAALITFIVLNIISIRKELTAAKEDQA